MRAGLGSFARRRVVNTGSPGRELTETERQLLPLGFEAVGEALASGGSAVAAGAVVGRTLALDGASLGEALSGLRATYSLLGGQHDGRGSRGGSPTFEVTEALCVAWGEATLEFVHDVSCEDPLTGLASLPHLRTRLAEVYREAERSGTGVPQAFALVVVDVSTGAGSGSVGRGWEAPFTRALRLATVAEALRDVFGGEETVARVGQDRAAALVRRTDDLGECVGLLRNRCADPELAPGVRVWIEGLPADHDLGVRLISELARA